MQGMVAHPVTLTLEGLEPGTDASLDSIDLGLDYRASPHLKKLPKSGWQDDSEDMSSCHTNQETSDPGQPWWREQFLKVVL